MTRRPSHRVVDRSARPVLTLFASLGVVLAVAGCGGAQTVAIPEDVPPAPTPASGGIPWPAPPNPLELTRDAGLTPETHEFFDYHVHAHLDVFVNAQPVPVPPGLGIDIENPAVRHGRLEDGTDSYGGIDPPCSKPCISPLHTHDQTGVVHTESAQSSPNRLGQLFTEWDVRLNADCVGGYCRPGTSVLVYVDGELYEGDPAEIELTDGKEVAIVIGTPPAQIPSSPPV
jgi:hypothetical protein